MADFIQELRKKVKLEKELEELEASRQELYQNLGQTIAAKQAEVTAAKHALQAAA